MQKKNGYRLTGKPLAAGRYGGSRKIDAPRRRMGSVEMPKWSAVREGHIEDSARYYHILYRLILIRIVYFLGKKVKYAHAPFPL